MADPSIILLDQNGTDLPDGKAVIGRSLLLTASGLIPKSQYEIRLSKSDGSDTEILGRLISNASGSIPPTCIWPQLGFENEKKTALEFLNEWHGSRGATQNISLVGEQDNHDSELIVAETFLRPVIYHSDLAGRLLNVISAEGKESVTVAVCGTDNAKHLNVVLTHHHTEWKIGDTYEALLPMADPAAAGPQQNAAPRIRIIPAHDSADLRPGAYDLIVTTNDLERDGWHTLRPGDSVTRCVPGLVVSGSSSGGNGLRAGSNPDAENPIVTPVNFLSMGGRLLSDAPYFLPSSTYDKGENLYAEFIPDQPLSSALAKRNCDRVEFSLVKHDRSFRQYLPANLPPRVAHKKTQPLVLRAQPSTMACGRFLLCPDLPLPGRKWTSPRLFDLFAAIKGPEPDQNLSAELSFVDGFFKPGVRVVRDPCSYANEHDDIGSFEYSELSALDIPRGRRLNYRTRVLELEPFLKVRGIVCFPSRRPAANEASEIKELQRGRYRLVLVAHGNTDDDYVPSYLGYNSLLRHLAHNGFIAASVHLKPGLGPVRRAHLMARHILILRRLFGKHLGRKVGVIGHSRSGLAAAALVRANREGELGLTRNQFDIQAVIGIAPSDDRTHRPTRRPDGSLFPDVNEGDRIDHELERFGESMEGDRRSSVPALLLIYGSLDGDVEGNRPELGMFDNRTAFSLYDRAKNTPKSMVFIDRANHSRFNEEWKDENFNLNKEDLKRICSVSAHQLALRGYVTAFLKSVLRNEWEYWREVSRGEWIPPSLLSADQGGISFQVQFQDHPDFRKVIDDFEIETNRTAIGMREIWTGPLHNLDRFTPHETRGLYLSWAATPKDLEEGRVPRLIYSLKHKEFSERFEFLSFRVGQTVEGAVETGRDDLDFSVRLSDTRGRWRSVQVRRFCNLLPPFQRSLESAQKSAMITVRIPLRLFGMRTPRKDEIDVTALAELSFDFDRSPKGTLLFDSLEFVRPESRWFPERRARRGRRTR